MDATPRVDSSDIVRDPVAIIAGRGKCGQLTTEPILFITLALTCKSRDLLMLELRRSFSGILVTMDLIHYEKGPPSIICVLQRMEMSCYEYLSGRLSSRESTRLFSE